METEPTSEQLELARAIGLLRDFSGIDLTQTLARIEGSLRGATFKTCPSALVSCGAKAEVLGAAGLIKRAVGQINVVIHALGILLCLPHLLGPEESVEYLSLGAGNTGRAFDLETNLTVAEFKFISWQGGPESIRQNGVFKDFYQLAEHPSTKRKLLYVLGTEFPLKFLNGRRALSSVMSRNNTLQRQFQARYGQQYQVVSDYYLPRRHLVSIEDVAAFVPELLEVVDELAEE